MKTLVASGGSLIDTAPSYGTAESVVGDLLAASQLRSRVFLATKLEDYNRDTAAAQLQTSLQQLRTERIDLMQLHSVSTPHQDLSILREWKSQGYCRYTGITTDKAVTWTPLKPCSGGRSLTFCRSITRSAFATQSSG